jgi:hypothetical protein
MEILSSNFEQQFAKTSIFRTTKDLPSMEISTFSSEKVEITVESKVIININIVNIGRFISTPFFIRTEKIKKSYMEVFFLLFSMKIKISKQDWKSTITAPLGKSIITDIIKPITPLMIPIITDKIVICKNVLEIIREIAAGKTIYAEIKIIPIILIEITIVMAIAAESK